MKYLIYSVLIEINTLDDGKRNYKANIVNKGEEIPISGTLNTKEGFLFSDYDRLEKKGIYTAYDVLQYAMNYIASFTKEKIISCNVLSHKIDREAEPDEFLTATIVTSKKQKLRFFRRN